MSKDSTVRVRFAPSPTGHLHLGSLSTALVNWLFARHNNGSYVVRFEDTDRERSLKEYQYSIEQSLRWLGLQSDEPALIQSTRIDAHKEVIRTLCEKKRAYPCLCSKEDLIDRCAKKSEEDFFITYDGYCRDRVYSEQDLQRPHVIRFAIPNDESEVTFHDLIRGTITFSTEQFDDFIIARSDGSPVYNLVVVADDAYMGISHVMRGEDHISNTPKQILLYKACEYTIPQFAHFPLIMGPSGDRLSKRDAAIAVDQYRKDGYLADALINYLARLGWSHGDQEIFTRLELIDYFSLDAVGKKGSVFDLNKLEWVNKVHIRTSSDLLLLDYIKKDIAPDIEQRLNAWNQTIICSVIALYKDRVENLVVLVEKIVRLHDGVDWQHVQKQNCDIVSLDMQKIVTYLENIHACLLQSRTFTHQSIRDDITGFVKKQGVKFVDIAKMLRFAIIGETSGPGLFLLLHVIGKDESLERIAACIAYAKRCLSENKKG